MARSSSIFITQERFSNVRGVWKLQNKIAAIPEEVRKRVRTALELDADDLVAKVQAIAPQSALQVHTDDIRSSTHKEDGRHELSVAVVVDAKDAEGRYYAAHVEYGHLAADGSHVPAEPFFWPAYNVLKKKLRSRLTRAMSAGVKAAAALGGNSPE